MAALTGFEGVMHSVHNATIDNYYTENNFVPFTIFSQDIYHNNSDYNDGSDDDDDANYDSDYNDGSDDDDDANYDSDYNDLQ